MYIFIINFLFIFEGLAYNSFLNSGSVCQLKLLNVIIRIALF